jgi:hypothetical protein
LVGFLEIRLTERSLPLLEFISFGWLLQISGSSNRN